MQMKVIIIYDNDFLVFKMGHAHADHFIPSGFACICSDLPCWIVYRNWGGIGTAVPQFLQEEAHLSFLLFDGDFIG